VIIRLDIEWTVPESVSDPASECWGTGVLYIASKPVWFRGSPTAPEAIEWSWIELLEFLASRWSYLTTEQTYPAGLVPEEPRELRRKLQRALRDTWNEDEGDRLDEAVFRFEECHDLARGLHGITLPSVLVVREGQRAWITTEDEAKLYPLDEVVRNLETIAEILHRRLSSGRRTPRSDKAIAAWLNREKVSSKQLIRLATGLSVNDFSNALPADNLEFWELAGDTGADSEIAAAARLSNASGHFAEKDRVEIIGYIKALERADTAKLDALSESLNGKFESCLGKQPFEQGYSLAAEVRFLLGLEKLKKVELVEIFDDLNIEIIEEKLSQDIDAVGCWGPRHGPAVVLNVNGRHSSSDGGKRATLAHELCHLFVDRSRSLPLTEVLGGRSPIVPERRANAFAAELLLPRSDAKEFYAKHRDVTTALDALTHMFGVGKVLAANQLRNSRPNKITIPEIQVLDKIISQGSDLSWD
jgi:Zn-dependent peptidase ImmA (M78 family)